MIQALQKLKNKKGFTLVELIVVLVILAILAALLVPALTGYIDKANKEKVVAETRQVVMAAQSTLSEAYGKGELDTTKDIDTKYVDEIKTLAEAKDSWSYIITVSTTEGKVGQVESVELWDGSDGCVYVAGEYYVKDSALKDAGSTLKVPTTGLTSVVKWPTVKSNTEGQQ